jgi:rare lipoprotein A
VNIILRIASATFAAAALAGGGQVAFADEAKPPGAAPAPHHKPALDQSGQVRQGKASFYNLPGRTMADGTPMNPRASTAASKTLPLGTAARVTNLRNGKSTVVEIRDRGPFVKGRIVDLSPKAAKDIGLDRKEGIAPVTVAPITIPLPDGSVRVGEGAAETSGTVID